MLTDIITFFKLLLSKKKLVIYCESNSYSCYFTEVLNQLKINNIKFTYICQKNDSNILKLGLKNYFEFNNIKFASSSVSSIQCEKLILTTPDFGDIVKISKKCKEHIYLFHSLVSSNMVYREKAFDNYDTICCVGPHHYREFLNKENKKKQKLLKIGYPFLDTLIKRKELSKNFYDNNKILIAPTWLPNEKNYYYENYFDLINILISKNYNVTFRPHPEFFKRFEPKLLEIKKKVKSETSFSIDLSQDSFDTLNKSKYLITDWSGISLEFAFIFKRPVLFLDTKKKILNKNFDNNDNIPAEITIRDQIGSIVKKSEFVNIDNILNELDKNEKKYYNNIQDCIDKHTYNYGRSAVTLIDYLNKN
jgi:YidC/Oxa1 family membrane protein insertase